jgi:hypothetical protein
VKTLCSLAKILLFCGDNEGLKPFKIHRVDSSNPFHLITIRNQSAYTYSLYIIYRIGML